MLARPERVVSESGVNIGYARMIIDRGASVFYLTRTINVGRSTRYRVLRIDGAPA